MHDTHPKDQSPVYDPARLTNPEFVASIPRREPVLGPERDDEFNSRNIERGWQAATEIVRRSIPGNEDLRHELQGFIEMPLSEQTPREFVAAVDKTLTDKENEARPTDKTVSRWGAALGRIGTYIQLPSVPDEAITPDITNAQRLLKPEQVAKEKDDMLRGGYYSYDDAGMHEYVMQYSGQFSNALTREEKDLIATRYRYARDVKLLALAAELTERPIQTEDIQQSDTVKEIVLPSGVEAVFSADVDDETFASLINPGNWEKRRQIKDRVYEVVVGGERYILKERKTDRHTDTKEKGHRPGNTSRREFEVAQRMRDEFGAQEGDLRIVWEKPLAAVTYPDGFQFALFEFNPVLEGVRPNANGEFGAEHQVANMIYRSPRYDEEFARYEEKTREWLGDKRERIEELTGDEMIKREQLTAAGLQKLRAEKEGSDSKARVRLFERFRGMRRGKSAADEETASVPVEGEEVTRVHYARLKANHMTERLSKLHRKIMFDAGMYNFDLDGYLNVPRVDNEGNVYLERHMFDLEYQFDEDPDRNEELRHNYETVHWPNRDRSFLRGDPFDDSPAIRAGRFALFEIEGGTVPESLENLQVKD